MKLIICLVVLEQIVSLKLKVKQLVLDDNNNELFSDSQVSQSYSQQTSEQICNNLVEMISSFGKDIMQNYAEIKYEDQLLGYGNKFYKQKDQISETYMDYMRVLCDFVIKESEEIFDPEMKNMVLSNLKDCKNGGDRCDGFDSSRLQVNDVNSFCNGVEYVQEGGQIYDGKDFKQRLDFDDQDYRNYTFMEPEQTRQCKQLCQLFNLCVKVHNIILVKKGSDVCFSPKFNPYSGSSISYYNQLDKQKCSDFVLPQFLYQNSRSILVKPESEEYCQNIPIEVRKNLNERLIEVEKKMKEIVFQKEMMKHQIEVKKEIKKQTDQMVSDISSSEKIWTACYGAIQSRSSLGLKPNLQIYKNLKLLVDVIDELFNLGQKVSLVTSEQTFIQGKLLSLKDLIYVYYRKINTTLSNSNSICENIQSLYTKLQEQKIKDIENNEYYVNEVNVRIKEGDITQLQNQYVDSNTDFKQLLHSVLQKFKGENQESSYDFMNLDTKYDYYKQISIALSEQKKLIITYAVQMNSVYKISSIFIQIYCGLYVDRILFILDDQQQ